MTVANQGGLAVVTGAAGGLGASFAHQLAERGYHLLLADRRPAQLEQVCSDIAAKYGVSVEPYPIDLCKRDEVERLAERLEQMEVALLVNNAGFGTVDYFADTDVNYLVGQADVHIVAPTYFTRAVLPGMLERNSGHIINVSSLGGWFRAAGNVQYGCTKHYLATFSMSLHDELRGTNVHVQALCPGFVRTEFHGAETMKAYQLRGNPPAAHLWMTADEVVACSLRKLGSKQVLVTPGFGYSIIAKLAQLPLLRPLFRWITRVPRVIVPRQAPAASASPPAIEHRAEPVFSVVKRA